ncbi:MAG: class I SAM-dependent methyltransferase [Lentisphaerae bacterium]|nr:MAG: class I SAM-dependent methyltransferase [Lentisphaerota bacterium]
MSCHKFDPAKLEKLNDPQRLQDIPPQLIWERLGSIRCHTLVEIGAGTGVFSSAFQKLCAAQRVFACDTEPGMVSWMEQNLVPKCPAILPVLTEETKLPLDDASADLVFMINVHHELDDPAAILAETFRILKSPGKIFIVDWRKEATTQGPPSRIRYTPERVREQMMAAGFTELAIWNDLPKHFLVSGSKASTQPD